MGASRKRDRATRPADQAPAGLGDTASVPSAAHFNDKLRELAEAGVFDTDDEPHNLMFDRKLKLEVARAIARELGDDFDAAFKNKFEWIKERGGDPFRDVNAPFKPDYLAAAEVAIGIALHDCRCPASAIEARSDATGTGAAEGESATAESGDAQ